MKKFTVTLLFGLLILAFGATAYGQPKLDFRASGFIDVVTNWYTNVTAGNPAAGIFGGVASTGVPALLPANPDGAGFNKENSWLATRARLKFDAIMEKTLSGTFLFEIDSTRWGENIRTGVTTDERNNLGVWNGDRGAMELKNLYFDFGIPYFGIPVPMTVRAGLQPLSIRPNILVYTDGMGITGGLDFGPVKAAPLWFKAIEGRDYDSDDVDVYGLHLNAKVAQFTLGGYGLYYNMNTYPFNAATQTAGATPSFNSDFWWFGAYADGKAGPVNINFDFIYDYGTVEGRANGGVVAPDVDYRGWMTRLKIDYPWEKFNFGTVLMYATGADQEDTDAAGLPGRAVAAPTGFGVSKDVDSFVVPPGSEAGFIFGESLVVYSTWVNRGTTGIGAQMNGNTVSRGGTGGTWMAKLYGSYKMTPWYKVTLAGLYIGDTTDNGDTFGNLPGHDGGSVGWELDLYNEFQVYKNLNFVVAGGYLWAGSAMKFTNGLTSENPRNPWLVTTALTYNF
jgi:hypothetical protein